QSAVHGEGQDDLGSYIRRLAERARYYRFFFLAPLYIAIPFFLWSRRRWIFLIPVVFALGCNFYPYFYSHYIAALTCLFVLIAVLGLQWLSIVSIRGHAAGADAARWIVFLCVGHFVYWYTIHLIGDESMWRYETWDAINYGDPDGRIAVNKQLAAASGKQLVF